MLADVSVAPPVPQVCVSKMIFESFFRWMFDSILQDIMTMIAVHNFWYVTRTKSGFLVVTKIQACSQIA